MKYFTGFALDFPKKWVDQAHPGQPTNYSYASSLQFDSMTMLYNTGMMYYFKQQ